MSPHARPSRSHKSTTTVSSNTLTVIPTTTTTTTTTNTNTNNKSTRRSKKPRSNSSKSTPNTITKATTAAVAVPHKSSTTLLPIASTSSTLSTSIPTSSGSLSSTAPSSVYLYSSTPPTSTTSLVTILPPAPLTPPRSPPSDPMLGALVGDALLSPQHFRTSPPRPTAELVGSPVRQLFPANGRSTSMSMADFATPIVPINTNTNTTTMNTNTNTTTMNTTTTTTTAAVNLPQRPLHHSVSNPTGLSSMSAAAKHERWAGGAFQNSPHPSALPLPLFDDTPDRLSLSGSDSVPIPIPTSTSTTSIISTTPTTSLLTSSLNASAPTLSVVGSRLSEPSLAASQPAVVPASPTSNVRFYSHHAPAATPAPVVYPSHPSVAHLSVDHTFSNSAPSLLAFPWVNAHSHATAARSSSSSMSYHMPFAASSSGSPLDPVTQSTDIHQMSTDLRKMLNIAPVPTF